MHTQPVEADKTTWRRTQPMANEHGRQMLLFLPHMSSFFSQKRGFGTYIMNRMIVLTSGIES